MLNLGDFFGDFISLKNSIIDGQSEHLCPICGYNYISFEKAYPIDYNNRKSSGIAIKFSCEAEHDFYIITENYTGNNYMVYTDERFNVIKSVIPQVANNSVLGEHNIQAINNGANSQIDVNNIEKLDEFSAEIIKQLSSLNLIQKAKIVIMIDEMKKENR